MIPRYYDIVVNPHNREIPNEGINRWYQLAVNEKRKYYKILFLFTPHTKITCAVFFRTQYLPLRHQNIYQIISFYP